MVARADDTGVAPTPSAGEVGSDLKTVAGQIEGLLDDDGQFNPNPDQPSRGHPDYDPEKDSRAQPRNEDGRFAKAGDESDDDAASDDEELDATGDDRNEDTPEGDTDDDLAASADDEAEADDEDTVTLESLTQLAETLEIPLDELKEQISHTFNAADGEVTVTLSELEKGYQKDADYRRSTAALADERRTFEVAQTQRVQGISLANQDAAHVIGVAENIVGAELQSPAMEALRDSDPAEWNARRTEIGERLGYLRGMRQQAAAKYQEYMTGEMAGLKQRETEALMTAVPDFGNEHRDIARKAIGSLGFTETEVKQVLDHRLIVAALELNALRTEVAELREAKEKGTAAAKDVRKQVPKVTKPGKSKTGGKRGVRAKRNNISRLRTRAQKSGSVGDAALVIENLI